jgi:hypothetical protein
MARVRRIRAIVEIENDDGSITRYETDGVPKPGRTEARIIPHFQTRIHRRAGFVEPQVVVEVGVFLNATLDHPMFRVTENPEDLIPVALPEAEVYRIIEAPADPFTDARAVEW